MEIQVKNIDHLGIIAGIVDQIGLVEEIDRHIEKHPQQLISTGQVVNPLDDVTVHFPPLKKQGKFGTQRSPYPLINCQ